MKRYFTNLKDAAFCILCCLAIQATYAQCPGTPSGDQNTYGQDQWIGYVYTDANLYATPPATVTTGTYRGYVTQLSNFDTDYGAGSISGANLCGTYADNFGIRYKMQRNFTPGYYTINIGGDDGYRLSTDGGNTYLTALSDWSLHAHSTRTATIYLSGTVNLVIEYFERAGQARVLFNYSAASCESTAPTAITGTTTVSCSGGTTLTATGGTHAVASTYQWGTGTTIGQNIISGQTGASITVTPTTTTTYWVRRVNGSPCAGNTAGITTVVNVTPKPGDPSLFGDNTWNAYAYTGSNIALTGTTYEGYYTQSTLGFDTTTGTNSWGLSTSPSSSAGWQGCTVPTDNFTLVYKRKGFPCGRYTLTMQRWDDEAILYINGVQVWYKATWSGTNPVSDVVGTFDLDANSTVEFRVREITGGSFGTLAFTEIGISVAPTAINGGNTTVCSATTRTLTATGGTPGANAVYQWGTGTVGNNIITGQTGASINVSPTETTTYWVRIYNTFCSTSTASVTTTLTVPTAGTLSSTSATACYNSIPSSITLSGNAGTVVKWQTANDAAFTQGVTDIVNTTATLSGAEIGLVTTGKYVRAVVLSICGQLTTPVHQISVTSPVTYNNGQWSSQPTATTAILVQGNLTLSQDLTVCSCEVANSATLTVNSGTNLTVAGKITVNTGSNLIVQNNGSILQTSNITNEGIIKIYRNSSMVKRLDYTLWSSPVQGQQLLAFSPNTLTNRFYEYNSTTNQYNPVSPQLNFEQGKGYLIRTPNDHPIVPTVYAGLFTGNPNNGTITKAVTSQQYYAIGNPYPSPISINDFIDTNISVLEGTLWFWRKTNDNTQSSYSTVTKFAYVSNSAPGGENSYATNPQGIVNTAQGFVVKSRANGNITFSNSMRRGNSSNQFFRTAQNNDASRFWLNLTNSSGNFSQATIGYTDEATTGYDNGLDGKTLMEGPTVLYSISGEEKLAIQARSIFVNSDIVALGFKTTTAGTFELSLQNTDGLFTGSQAIYLKDNVTGTVQNLRESSYSFTSEAGIFENRFEIVYTSSTLSSNNNLQPQNIIIYQEGKQLHVNSSSNIKSVTVHDLLGRVIYSNDVILKQEFVSPVINASQQVIVITVVGDENRQTTKKLLFK